MLLKPYIVVTTFSVALIFYLYYTQIFRKCQIILLLGAYSGCITKIIAICRDYFIILKSKNKLFSSNIFLIIFILIYIVTGILTYKSIWSVLPVLAAIIYIVPVWNGDELTIKKTAFVCYFLWLIYNIFVFSIAGIVSNVISIISTFVAIKIIKLSVTKM